MLSHEGGYSPSTSPTAAWPSGADERPRQRLEPRPRPPDGHRRGRRARSSARAGSRRTRSSQCGARATRDLITGAGATRSRSGACATRATSSRQSRPTCAASSENIDGLNADRGGALTRAGQGRVWRPARVVERGAVGKASRGAADQLEPGRVAAGGSPEPRRAERLDVVSRSSARTGAPRGHSAPAGAASPSCRV